MKTIQHALLAEKEPHVQIDPADVPGYSPLSSCRAESAIYLPREGGIPAEEVITLLDKAARALSIQRIDGKARTLVPSEGGCAVRMENERVIHGRSVLLAAGAWSSALINSIPELADSCPRVQFGIGRAYRVRHEDNSVRPRTVLRLPNQPSGGGYHLVSFNNDTAYVGASNHCATHPDHDDERSAFPLVDVADRLRRELLSASIQPILGHRPISADGMPLLGRTRIDSVLIATGTRRDGFTTAPAIAENLIDELLEGEPRFEHVFKPDRCGAADVVSIA
jgi:glycine/D-amino acid oxidase-like deaminating enzyme